MRRIFDYNYRISREYGLPVASLALLADEDSGWRPNGFRSEVLGAVLSFSFPTAKLLDYAARSDELMAMANPFALVSLAHLHTQRAHPDPDELYAAKWELTKQLYQHGWSEERIITLFKVINWMMALPQPHQRRYWRAVLQLDKERNMELMNPLEQMFFDDGVEAGLKKGLEQGRREAVRAMVERMLARRFGPLSKTTQAKLARASLDKLGTWGEALLEAQSLKQVFEPPAIG